MTRELLKRLILFLIVGFFPWLAWGMSLRLTGDEILPTYIQERLQQTAQTLYGPDVKASFEPQKPVHRYEKNRYTAFIRQEDGSLMKIPLIVSAELLPHPKEAFLLFSDHPEILKENGILFSAGIIFLRPVRLNFYHENGADQPPRTVVIRLDNPSAEPAFVRILDSITGPGKNEVSLGHQASLLFLYRKIHQLGYIATVPPRNHLVLSRQFANPGELVNGFLEILELSGHPLQLSVLSEDPTAPEPTDIELESKDTHVRGAYEMPRLFLQASYRAGDPATIIPLGDIPLKNLLPGGALKGAYGMLWEGDVLLKNPHSSVETVPLYFQPRGGGASGTFVLDGFFKEVAATPAYEKILLATYTLPPKSRRIVHFLTMPEGGSSYPIRLIVGQAANL